LAFFFFLLSLLSLLDIDESELELLDDSEEESEDE
jgi:hypothetical protein